MAGDTCCFLYGGCGADGAGGVREAGIETAGIARPRHAGDFFRIARGVEIAIGVRLHCAVLSCCAGVAPLGVAYRDKGLDFAKSMNISPWMIDPEQMGINTLAERAESLVQTAGSVASAAHERALHWRSILRRYAADA